LDPYSGAQVMSRGIVGTRDGAPTVASPLHKQLFDLRTGLCLDTKGGEPASLRVWTLVERDGDLLLDVGDLLPDVAETAGRCFSAYRSPAVVCSWSAECW